MITQRTTVGLDVHAVSIFAATIGSADTKEWLAWGTI